MNIKDLAPNSYTVIAPKLNINSLPKDSYKVVSGEIPSPYQEPKMGIEPTYKASIGGASTIIPNVAKTIGNIPSSAGNIIDIMLQSTAGNIGRSLETGQNIFKEQGLKEGVKNIGAGFADTGKKIFEAPGKFLVGTNDKMNLVKDLSPTQELAIKQRDELTQKIGEARKLGDTARATRLTQALKGVVDNLASLDEQIGTQEQRKYGGAESLSNVIKYPIERPLDIPLALYGGKKATTGTDIITDIAKPVTRGADTSAIGLLTKTKSTVSESLVARQPKAINELEQTYNDIMSGTTPGKKKIAKIETKTEALNRAGTEGKTPMRTLAEDGIIPNQSGTKLDTFEQAQQYKQKITPLRDANRQALQETGLSTAPVKLDDLEAKAIEYARIPDNINAGRFDSMQRDIQNEFNLLRQHYPSGEIPLNIVDDIKSARWDNVFKNKGLIEADVLKKNSEYAIAKSLQKSIEETAAKAGNSEVAQLNRAIGDRLEASKFLEDLNGKTIKGGRLLKYLTTGIGASLGNTFAGKIIGAIGGNLVGDLILSNTIASPIKRLILRNLETTNPQAYKNTLEWLSKQNLDRETRLLLSAPKPQATPLGGETFIGSKVDASGNPIIPPQTGARILPAEKNPVSVNPQTGKFQTSYRSSQSKSPANQQTIPAITRTSNIPPTIPNPPKKSSILTKPEGTKKSSLFVEANIPQDLQPLAQEARKYKSAEEFVKAHQANSLLDLSNPSKHRFGRIFDEAGGEGIQDTFDIVKEYANKVPAELRRGEVPLVKSPDELVTIYRGTVKGQNKLEVGDFVSFSKDYALSHNNGEKLLSLKVPAKDVIWQGNDMTEWVYSPSEIRNQYKDLTDFYNKTVGKKGKNPLLSKTGGKK